MSTINVTVWNEFRHEQTNEQVRAIYPDGIHEAIASHLRSKPDLAVKTATLDEPEHGLTEEVLAGTDVMLWWGHKVHHEVADEIVDRVHARVLDGMGLIVLHSAHFSKIFGRLMGTTANLYWRDVGETERLWVVNPYHPIAQGIDRYIELDKEEMYGEYFDIAEPEQLIFVSWFEGGEVFRSGAVWHRGKGKLFYFRPGHETFPTYHNPQILQVIENAVRWAAFSGSAQVPNIVQNSPDPISPLSGD